jgi:hypothetical protein
MTHNLARPMYMALNSALAMESLSSEDRGAVLRLIDVDTPLGMRACMNRLKPLLIQAQAVLTKYQHIGD